MTRETIGDLSIVNFYDAYSQRQINAGINQRHKSILSFLKENGFKENHSVLEIGCGIGTVSGLMAKFLSKGNLISIDISPQSIEIAKTRLSKFRNIEFIATDVCDWTTDKKFDVVVFPDVLEHIPISQHQEIFQKTHSLLRDDGFVFINIPDPVFLDWIRINHPDKLQIIDQSLFLSHFDSLAKSTDFYIIALKSYSVWQIPLEYRYVVLRKIKFVKNIELLVQKPSFMKKVLYKLGNK